MSCEDVRQALPLLPGTHPDDAARVRAHAAGCGGCAELLEAYDGDDRALSALRLGAPAAPLDGFTAQVMARIAQEERRPAAPPRPLEAAILPFGESLRRLAAAAAVLLAIAVGLLAGGPPAVEPDLQATAPTPPPQQQAPVEVTPVAQQPGQQLATTPELAAPRRFTLDRDPAPMPLRRRGPVVPVDEGRRGARGGQGGGELLEAIEEVLPDFHRRMMRQFGDGRQAREVRF
ncbi:MAG: hypothetical protein M9894_32240 [Planctomycetes bacterium]|nr:hypothetical protein [Planctomycetota bacterium]